MQKTLIIKQAAAGDVVRTTSILNVLEGKVYWVVNAENAPLFSDIGPGLELITNADTALATLSKERFNLVVSLEEQMNCAQLASSISAQKLTGVYLQGDRLTYTDDAADWFDMSLISKKGQQNANELKLKNSLSFQHILFKMVGRKFANHPPIIYRDETLEKVPGLIGIDSRVGETWPNKRWTGYDELILLLKSDGYTIKLFGYKENVREYLDEIATCSCIISGDSLPMHVAIAYEIPSIAIFNCTPPNEIHGYGLLRKIVSPLLHQNLYSRIYSEEVVRSVSVMEVYDAFKKLGLQK
jgi:heptosyltransferase-2